MIGERESAKIISVKKCPVIHIKCIAPYVHTVSETCNVESHCKSRFILVTAEDSPFVKLLKVKN